MTTPDFVKEAAAWVNRLVPEQFDHAASQISSECAYVYNGQTLTGPVVINAFRESHERASRELDQIHYLEGSVGSWDSDATVINVSDRISLNGRTHVYNDRLRVCMKHDGEKWMVLGIEHLPIQEEKDALSKFLQHAGPKRPSARQCALEGLL